MAHLPMCVLLAAWAVQGSTADQEFATAPFPVEGATGQPDTYLPDIGLTSCGHLDPYPAAVDLPWAPTVDEAKAFCSKRAGCGGFIYTTPAAALAQGGASLAEAAYCRPQTHLAGTASATSAIGFVRRLYASCDVRVVLPSSLSTFHGALGLVRNVCIQPSRGMSSARDRSPRPSTRHYRAAPKPMVRIDGVDYRVGEEVFIDEEAARNASADGMAHSMETSSGVEYFMPGGSHAIRDQSEKPFALDGYFPLFSTEAAAQAASTRGGGNGQAHAVGPTIPPGLPVLWTAKPCTQTYYMPSDGAVLFLGDYVAPFALDGYFPLYKTILQAQKASADGTAQNHGPGSEMGHPLSWSTGVNRIYFMPAAGPDKFYGDYVGSAAGQEPLYAAALRPTSAAGPGIAASAAAQAVAAAAMPTNTAAAAATLAAAPAPSALR